MAKQETIKNTYDGSTALDVYDRKYLKYFTADYTDKMSVSVFNALKSKDIKIIEGCLKDISNTASNFLLHIGLVCLVIEKERLYEGTEFGVSYMRYAEHLFDELNIPQSTISDSKIIVEQFITHYRQLMKHGFKMSRNANKLRYLNEALENHKEDEVFTRIVTDNFRDFRDWAQKKNYGKIAKPEKEIRVDAVIKGNQLFINGKNILNFPKGLKTEIKELVKTDLQKTFSIREGGNQPYIVSTYGRGEQTAIQSYLAKIRSKK